MANEKRLIDANALKGDFMFLRKMWSSTEVMTLIANAPTVDAVEVVHGRWEWFDDENCGCYRCSCCDYAVGYPTNFCPNCGAKMDGGDEDGC